MFQKLVLFRIQEITCRTNIDSTMKNVKLKPEWGHKAIVCSNIIQELSIPVN